MVLEKDPGFGDPARIEKCPPARKVLLIPHLGEARNPAGCHLNDQGAVAAFSVMN